MGEVHRAQVVPNNPHTPEPLVEGYCVTRVCVSGHASLGHSPVEVSSDKVVYFLLRLSMEVLKLVEGTVWERRREEGEGGEGKGKSGWEGKG